MARKVLDTKKANRNDWLEARKRGIGGSDAGTIMGMNPYSSLIKLYADKTGLSTDKEDNEAMRLGRDLEQYVAMRFSEETGKSVRNDNFMYCDDEYDFIVANIDRRVVGENAGLECKTMGSSSAKFDFAGGEIPAHYYAQCQHYMMVMGWERCYLAILVLQRGIHIKAIDRNEEFIKSLRTSEIAFWKGFVEPGIMPQPDGSDSSLELLRELYPTSKPQTEMEIYGLDEMVEEYLAAGDLKSHYEELQNEVKARICAKLGDTEIGTGDRYAVSWKSQSKVSLDTKKLQEQYPDAYSACLTTSTYRVFRKKKMTKKKGA